MRTNYYKDLPADYSKPGLVSAELGQKLLRNAEKYIALREERLPEIGPAYSLERVERENKEWWPTHCEALRQGRGDLLAEEYARELVYFCADGPFYGRNAGIKREANWWAILAQPGVTMAWPIVMFHGEVVYFEWLCTDDETCKPFAKRSMTFLRPAHQHPRYF